MRIPTTPPLRTVIAGDAVTCTSMGAALLAASSPVAHLTAIPQPLLFWAGAILLPIAVFMAFAALRPSVPAWAAAVIIAGNVFWVGASLLLPIAGLIAPNAFGWVFLLGQAAVVAVFAKLERDATRGADALRTA